MIRVYINNVAVPQDDTLKARRSTVSVLQQTGVSTADITLVSIDRSQRPLVGADVVIDEKDAGGTFRRIFGGRILNVKEEVRPETGWRDHLLSCVDYSWVTRHRTTGERTFTDTQRNDIIRLLNTEALDLEGFTVDDLPAGEGGLIKELKLVFGTVAEAYDELARLTGTIWFIDFFKRIRFVEEIQPTARFILDNSLSDTVFHPKTGRGSLVIEESLDETANRIVVRFGKTQVAATTETFNNLSAQNLNGARNSFQMVNEIASTPTIRVDGVAKTVGIDNVDTGKDWYWSEGSKQINQDSGATALTSTQVLEVDYVGLQYTALYRQNDTHIGIYGVRDKLIDISAATTVAASEEVADAAIDALSQNTLTVSFPCRLLGNAAPQVGDRIDITRTGYPSINNLVVKSVRLTPTGQIPETLWRQVTATRGPRLKNGQALLSSGSVSGTGASGVATTGGGGGTAAVEPWVAITSPAANLILDHAASNKFRVTLDKNITLKPPANLRANTRLLVLLVQDVTGGRTVAFDAAWKMRPINGDVIPISGTHTVIDCEVDDALNVRIMKFETGIPI